jgi:hypothetical protein
VPFEREGSPDSPDATPVWLRVCSQQAEALEHLDFTIAEFRDMKMQPSLERALRYKDILKA